MPAVMPLIPAILPDKPISKTAERPMSPPPKAEMSGVNCVSIFHMPRISYSNMSICIQVTENKSSLH